MLILRSLEELRSWRKSTTGHSIGFVPTMGALHPGHLSLVALSNARCELTVASIFVNPLQFGPTEDLDRYPRPFEQDCALLRAANCDVLFAPLANEITPPTDSTFVREEKVSSPLCGALRPGHFQGVTTIVLKLFHLVQPEFAFFGQKDAQQCAVLERMVRDLFVPVTIVRGATLREADGLAMSSRNAYLTSEERAKAPRLYQALQAVREAARDGERSTDELEALGRRLIATEPSFRLQYFEIRNRETLEREGAITPLSLATVAAVLGKTRLIDNLALGADA